MIKRSPILFQQDMVRAILSGQKTQTRRPVKPQPIHRTFTMPGDDEIHETFLWRGNEYGRDQICHDHPTKNPYGKKRDVLWVREAFFHNGGSYCYAADYQPDSAMLRTVKWKPGIHMPKEACRVELHIRDVKIERLGEITDGDARKEGADGVGGYRQIWERINGDGSWAINPWVWVIVFRSYRL